MKPPIEPQHWTTFVEVLKSLNKGNLPDTDMTEAKGLIAKLYKQARKESRKEAQQDRVKHDSAALESTLRCQKETLTETPLRLPLGEGVMLQRARSCYICKNKYQQLDYFYHLLCPSCASSNRAQRDRTADLSNITAIVTGARIKIGHEAALRLLRCGATVIATTRFPQDAAQRFRQAPDFKEWCDRLEIYALDLRYLDRVIGFVASIQLRHSSLEVIINNAAQTLKRPAEYEETLLAAELKCAESSQLVLSEAITTQLPDAPCSPIQYSFDNEPLDVAKSNSWKHTLENAPIEELLETHLITSFSPFILNSRLKPLMLASSHPARFIVNVSAMEGQFARENKTSRHPHTNMAKASMNMMTRTSAVDYAGAHIYMNSVDTGWITNENPFAEKVAQRKRGFVPPLDCIDGAARVLAPVFDGIDGMLYSGQFLKDFKPHEW